MTPLPRITHRVRSGDVQLHVVEVGTRGRPPLLLVHGFPDAHDVYDPLLDDLGRDFHVATFDLRGIGESTPPATKAGYRIEAVLPDFDAVIDAVFGAGESVHLVAHDWGSVLSFSYVSEPGHRARVRSFISVSGPHLGLMWADNLRHIASGRLHDARRGLGQLASSWYALFFQLPWLPEWLFRRYGPALHRGALLHGGVSQHDPYLHKSAPEVWQRVQHGLELYRQNALRPPKIPARGSIDVPLSLVVAERDPFVRPQTYGFLHEYATNLTVHRVAANHWLPRSHPGLLASIVRAQVARVEGVAAEASAELR